MPLFYVLLHADLGKATADDPDLLAYLVARDPDSVFNESSLFTLFEWALSMNDRLARTGTADIQEKLATLQGF
jgi:hypothetical protein